MHAHIYTTLLYHIKYAALQNLVYEREGRQKEVANEVGKKWASAQTLTGPFLIIPYKIAVKDSSGHITNIKKFAHFLPNDLNINGNLLPEIRYRTIYKIIVYKSQSSFEGNFIINPSAMGITSEDLLLNEAKVCFGLSDFRGIEERIKLKWNNTDYVF